MQSNLHPVFKTIIALVGLGLTAWEAIGRTGDPRFPLLILYVVMMGLVSPQALERIINRLYPGPNSDSTDTTPPSSNQPSASPPAVQEPSTSVPPSPERTA